MCCECYASAEGCVVLWYAVLWFLLDNFSVVFHLLIFFFKHGIVRIILYCCTSIGSSIVQRSFVYMYCN